MPHLGLTNIEQEAFDDNANENLWKILTASPLAAYYAIPDDFQRMLHGVDMNIDDVYDFVYYLFWWGVPLPYAMAYMEFTKCLNLNNTKMRDYFMELWVERSNYNYSFTYNNNNADSPDR